MLVVRNKTDHTRASNERTETDQLDDESAAAKLEQFDDPLLYTDRICEQCGLNHGYRPTFEGVKTSIDVVPELIEFLKRSTTNDRK